MLQNGQTRQSDRTVTGRGHAGLSESLIWDSDDTPSLQNPLPRAEELCFRGSRE